MLSKIFGKKDAKSAEDEHLKELQERIAKMNLSELSLYVKGKIEGLELSEEGLVEVLRRLTSKINDERYFLDASDDDSKLKKGFELVLLCAKSNRVTLKAMELIAEFANLYGKLIKEYDRKYKEIYEERMKKAIEQATEIIEAKVALQNKMNMID